MASNLPNLEPFIQAGMNPRTGLPVRLDAGGFPLKSDIKRILRIKDEQACINRFKWEGLPDDLDGQLLERILYYRGQGVFFYMEALGKFYFLPYALNGEIDVYGRYTGITPLPFNGQMGSDEKERKPWIKGLIKYPIYKEFDDTLKLNPKDACVLLSDYSKQISQTVLPRQQLNESIIDTEADCIPFMRTALLNSTGVQGMRVGNQDEYAAVEQASRAINEAALNGKKYVPVVGQIDFQELTGGTVAKSEEFLMAMQSIDNFRLSTIGVQNGGLFQKKAHELQSESDMNAGGDLGYVMQDGLILRQKFCDFVNSIPDWNLNISVSVNDQAESAIVDIGENVLGDEEDNQEATNE